MNVPSSMIHQREQVETTQYPSTNERINRMWSIHTVKYYLAIKKNEILIHATMWMNLGDIMLREIPPQKRLQMV